MAQREFAVTQISPLSAFRVALALSLVGLVAWMLCVVICYVGLDAAGVWSQLNAIIGGVGGERAVSFGMVVSFAALVGAVLAILITVLAPLVAVVYNSTVDLFGGLVITLRDERRS